MAELQEKKSVISTALESGDFHDTALPLLESTSTEDELSLLPCQRTPLHYACQHGRVDVAQRLVTNGKCSIESRDAQGCTPLHTAAQYGKVEMLKYLLHRLFSHKVSDLTMKMTRDGKLAHALTAMFQQKLLARHRDWSGNTPLHTACVHGQLNVVHLFTRAFSCDPDHTNSEGLSCLHLAAQHGHLPLVRYLVEEVGSEVSLEDKHGRSPAYLAAGAGHLDILKYLIEEQEADRQFRVRKMSTTKSVTSGRSLLHIACRGGHLDVVQYLVEHCHCDPTSKDDGGFTSLHFACQESHQDIVTYLIMKGRCDAKSESNNGTTCLHSASIGCIEVVRYLHTIHNCLIKYNSDRNTPLHFAVDSGRLDIAKYLIEEMKCDPNLRGEYRRTPLHLACRGGYTDIVKYLVDEHKCDVNCSDEDGITPLHSAASDGKLDIIEYLIDTHHCNVLARNYKNNLPLHYAAHHGHLDVVKLFIEKQNCKPHSEGEHKKKPLHFASATGHLDVVKYLVGGCCCDPLCQDEDKATPLHRAAANGQAEIIRYFVDVLVSHDLLVRDMYNRTPLHYAATNGCLGVVKFFIEVLGIDPDTAARGGKTPLFYALDHEQKCFEAKHFEVCKYLIDHEDCNIFAKVVLDSIPTNPMVKAVDNENLSIIKYACATCRLDPVLKLQLVKRTRNDFIRRCLNNYTDPLHQAAKTGDVRSVKYYIEKKKWSPAMLTACGNNALHTAAQHGQLEVVKYLTGLSRDEANEHVQLLCDPRLKNKNGRTAEDLALQSERNKVVFYLQTIAQSVLQHSNLSHCLNIFVVGNTESGKSTLIQALCKEGSILGKKIQVRGVTPLTAGIVPTMFNSKKFGKASFYDFAGHKEYYASHEIILHQTDQPLVLLAVDVSLPPQEVETQVEYWVSILSRCSSTDTDKTVHVVVIGSHWDLVTKSEKGEIRQRITSILSNDVPLKYHGLILCDCRYSDSNGLNELRQRLNSLSKEIHKVLAAESDKHCASLLPILPNPKKQPTITVRELHELITTLNPDSKLADPTLLLATCKNLSSYGHLFFLQGEKMEESLLILNPGVILSRIHACFKPIKKVTDINQIGLMEKSQLEKTVASFPMKPELAIKYLTFNHFCTKITSDQLLSASKRNEGITHYFFPNLVSASRPDDFSDGHKYSQFYTWCLKCIRQFFTPLFLHTLFIQLVECGRDNVLPNAEFKIWMNGILLVYNGTRSIIEVTDQTTSVYLAIQCIEGHESHLVRQRALLVSLIKSLVRKVCPTVDVGELIFPPSTYPPSTGEIPVAKVIVAIRNGHDFVPYREENSPTQVLVKDLLYFDSLLALKGIKIETLQDILSHSESSDIVPSSAMKEVRNSVKDCSKLVQLLASTDLPDQEIKLSYKQLLQEMIHYSILDRNLIILTGIDIPHNNLSDMPDLSDAASDPLTINDLYCVNVNLISLAHLWKEVGLALGLLSSSLAKIRSNNRRVEHCFTKVLAAWLKGENRPHDSPVPTWKEIIAALWRDVQREHVYQLVERLARMAHPEDPTEVPEDFFTVDNRELDSQTLSKVANHVYDLNHKWFHLGLSLGLRYPTLEAIEASPDHHRAQDYMTDTLSKWLEGVDLDNATAVRGPCTWRSLTLALNSPLVDEKQVARRILQY